MSYQIAILTLLITGAGDEEFKRGVFPNAFIAFVKILRLSPGLKKPLVQDIKQRTFCHEFSPGII